MPDLVTLGESMLRFSMPVGGALERATRLDVNVAGAESNVAITARRMGLSTGWVSRLPDNPLGRLVSNTVASQGVDTSRVVWAQQGRMGTYYLEIAAPPRANRVIYDRAGSAITAITTDEVDWDYIGQARALHLTGITPALGPACAAVVQRAVDVARQRNVILSFDLNYRAKLWSPAEAAAHLTPLIQGVHILRAGADEARALFGLAGDAAQVARQLQARFDSHIALVTDGNRPAAACGGGNVYTRECHPVQIVDEIGAGDAFSAGFLVKYLETGDVEHSLAFAQALAALKLTYSGDLAWCTRQDVEALLANTSSGWR